MWRAVEGSTFLRIRGAAKVSIGNVGRNWARLLRSVLKTDEGVARWVVRMVEALLWQRACPGSYVLSPATSHRPLLDRGSSARLTARAANRVVGWGGGSRLRLLFGSRLAASLRGRFNFFAVRFC